MSTYRADDVIAQEEVAYKLIRSKRVHQFTNVIRSNDHFAEIHASILIDNAFAELGAFHTIVRLTSSIIQLEAFLITIQLGSAPTPKMVQEWHKIGLVGDLNRHGDCWHTFKRNG